MIELIKSRRLDTDTVMRFEVDLGEDIQDAIARFGERSVFNRYLIGAKTSARNRITKLKHKRNQAGEFLSEEEIRDKMEEWSPKSPDEQYAPFSRGRLREEYDNATPEQQAEIREELRRVLADKGHGD